jgi:hypothetical protein
VNKPTQNMIDAQRSMEAATPQRPVQMTRDMVVDLFRSGIASKEKLEAGVKSGEIVLVNKIMIDGRQVSESIQKHVNREKARDFNKPLPVGA